MKLKTTPTLTLTDRQRRSARLVTAEDVLYSCRAAARLAMQGDNYSPEDRDDTATRLVILVLERAKLDAETAPGDLYPARLIGMDFLTKRAANERRALDARRAKLELESGDDSSEESSGALKIHGAAAAEDASPINDGTPWGARRAALDLLADIGVWEGARRWTLTPNADRGEYAQGALWNRETGAAWDAPASAPRAEAPAGPVWTLAYTVARATAGGMDAAEIAEELDLTPATHRKHLSRAVSALSKSGADIRSWVDALNADGLDWTRPDATAKERERTRLHADDHAPIITRKTGKRASAKGADWSRRAKVARQDNGRKTVGGPDTPVDPLTPGRRARLEKASSMRRARAAARTEEERRTARAAAGLPAEVR